jgi:hypothetical protein
MRLDLLAGQVPAGAGLGTLPRLEVEGLDAPHLVDVPPEAPRRQLVEVPRVGRVLLGQHAPLAGADARARHLGALGQRLLRLLGERPEAHVGHEDGDVEVQRLLRTGPDHHPRPHGLVVQQRHAVQLGGDELQIVPRRQQGPRDPHGRDRAVVADLAQPVPGQRVDVLAPRLIGGAVHILVQPQVLVAPVGLGVHAGPLGDGVGVHQDLVALDPGCEAVQRLGVGVLADAGVQAVVPAVDPADQVGAVDVTVGHERAAMQAAPEQDRAAVVPAHDHQIDLADEGSLGLTIDELGPDGDGDLVHGATPGEGEGTAWAPVGGVPGATAMRRLWMPTTQSRPSSAARKARSGRRW